MRGRPPLYLRPPFECWRGVLIELVKNDCSSSDSSAGRQPSARRGQRLRPWQCRSRKSRWRQHFRTTVPQIAAMLTKHGFRTPQHRMDLPSPSSGFFHRSPRRHRRDQGLRRSAGKAIAAVSRLEAIARSSGKQGYVIAALDAGRHRHSSVNMPSTMNRASAIKGAFCSVGGTRHARSGRPLIPLTTMSPKPLRQSGARVLEIQNPRADAVPASAGKNCSRRCLRMATARGNYIRRTDAEISHPWHSNSERPFRSAPPSLPISTAFSKSSVQPHRQLIGLEQTTKAP